MPALMTRTFRWKDPADRSAGRRPGPLPPRPAADVFAAAAANLRAHPGRWAVVAEFEGQGSAANLSVGIRAGRTLSWQPAGSFDSTTRKEGDVAVVYARYVGEPEQS
jgi:hypothetical protein